MSTATEPTPIDPDRLLQHQIHYQVVNTLFALLPPPIDNTPASLNARNEAATARVSDLRPVNADEIDIALHYVLSRAQAADVMRAIRENAGNAALSGQLMRQFALMERTAHADRRLLLQVQAARHKREAIAGTADTDAWTAYTTRRRLQDAAGQGPVPRRPERLPEPSEAPPQPTEHARQADPPRQAQQPQQAQQPEQAQQPRQAEPARQAAPSPEQPPIAAPRAPSAAPPAPRPLPLRPTAAPVQPAQPPASAATLSTLARALAGPDPSRDLAAEADRYVRDHPRRARLLRQHGEVPAGYDFPEPDDHLLYAIITGSSPALCALDPPNAAAA
jgi:outer membrane biosynthesis protein TonB